MSWITCMCSTKLAKLTLSLWEQSLHNKAEIPSWQGLNSFRMERHRTLEAIVDVRPSGSSQSMPISASKNKFVRDKGSTQAQKM